MRGVPRPPYIRPPEKWRRSRERSLLPALLFPTLGLILFGLISGGLDIKRVWRNALSADVLKSTLLLSVLLAVSGIALWNGFARRLWHDFANAFFVGQPVVLKRPWVVDGDTIDDRATGVRYRLANIDAPETGDNARCFNENRRGELATSVTIGLVRRAKTVSVRKTFRHDIYGRRVAFVLIDGEDLGETLVARGLAVPWQGRRKRWCGRSGGLAKIARTGVFPHSCGACRAWR